MANEWVLVDRTEDPLDYVVDNSTGMEKGQLSKMTDSGTAIISSAVSDRCAGVTAREKVSGSGRTQLAHFKKGRFMATCSGAVTTGAPASSYADANYPNVVGLAAASDSGAALLGYFEGDGTDAERVQLRLDL